VTTDVGAKAILRRINLREVGRHQHDVGQKSDLDVQLGQYEEWRNELMRGIQSYIAWLENNSVISDDDDTENDTVALYETLEALKHDKLTVALVGEYSRGKTELINAIFFADYKRRLLPSTPGRTTMCPTEMLFDEGTEPCLRLLPIETRKDKKSVSQYKREPVNWTVKPLNIESVDEMTIALKELVATQRVSVAEANNLGFGVNADSPDVKDGMVDVPTWRHAMINYPHPLLKRGLVVLDTPGLNALGSEPELTLRMLPAAHAVIFVLAADTGVTHSDLQIWKNHVCVATHMTDGSRFAALNKIDTLWDELLSADQIRENIKKQVAETARLLEMNTSNVFPVSAAKGLLGKIREDEKLLISTGLPHLERQVSQRIVSAKRDILREKVVGDIGGMVEGSRQIISTRLDKRHEEIAELGQGTGRLKDLY